MAKKNYSDSDMKKYFSDPKYRTKKRKSNPDAGRNRLIAAGIIFTLFLAFAIFIFSGLPSLEELENPKPVLASKVYSVDGEVLGQFFIENRIETDIDSIPKPLIQALIATEDRRFYVHWGVDLSRFAKAMVKNVFTFSREGASTITQQLAKNLYKLKTRNENIFETGVRKIREWITAIQIEKTYTKNEILELYLNVSYFGRGAYGIESAAQEYFGKDASELTIPEASLFVALLKSSANYDPLTHYDNALARRNLVMSNMVDVGYLSEEKYQELKQQPIVLTTERVGGVKSVAPHFMEYVRQQMTAMATKYGYDLYRDGLNIYTTVDMRMQKIANSACEKHLADYQKLFDKNWNWSRNKSLLASLLTMRLRIPPNTEKQHRRNSGQLFITA